MTWPPKAGLGILLVLGLERGLFMVRRVYTLEQVVNRLREAEVLLSQDATEGEAVIGRGVQKHGMSCTTKEANNIRKLRRLCYDEGDWDLFWSIQAS